MLSYLQEQNNISDKQDSRSRKNQQTQKQTTVATRQAQLKKTNRLLIALFFAGLFCLWIMILKSSPQTASAQQQQAQQTEMEITLARMMGIKSELNSNTRELVKKFQQLNTVEQIKLGDLKKNPFEIEHALAALTAISAAQRSGSRGSDLLNNQLKDLQLLSIMLFGGEGGRSCCMINDKILYEGDIIGELKVASIKEKSVSLVSNNDPDKFNANADNVTVILKLDTEL